MNAAVFRKELRALFPVFFAALVTLALATRTARVFHLFLVLSVSVLGPIVLGAMVIGHEYAHRTLTLMLAQPISRARLLAAKAAVLFPMVAVIAAAVFFALPEGFAFPGSAQRDALTVLVLAPLCGLCLAPALSILCRSPLAAVVFTIAIPGLVMLFAQIAGTAINGFRNPLAVNDFTFAVTWPTIALLCLAGAVATWLLFQRLQAIEGHAEFQLPAWLGSESPVRSAPRVHSAWSALVRKELRLQQLAYVVSVLYLLAAGAIWALQEYAPEFPRIPVEALSVMYSGLVAMLIGSVASAEERQLGTLPAQLLQPIAAWKQWGLKVATVVGLSLLLAIALPLLVGSLVGTGDNHVMPNMRFFKQAMVPLIIVTSISLYVSSLSSSGIRAMVASLPVIAGGLYFTALASDILVRAARRTMTSAMEGITSADRVAVFGRLQSVTDTALLAGMVLIAVTALWFGYLNHRRIDRPGSAAVVQAAILAAAVVFVAVLPAIVILALGPR